MDMKSARNVGDGHNFCPWHLSDVYTFHRVVINEIAAACRQHMRIVYLKHLSITRYANLLALMSLFDLKLFKFPAYDTSLVWKRYDQQFMKFDDLELLYLKTSWRTAFAISKLLMKFELCVISFLIYTEAKPADKPLSCSVISALKTFIGGPVNVINTASEYIRWQWRNSMSMPVGFRRHLVGKTLRNVCYCNIAWIWFVSKLMIIWTYS